MRIAFVTQWFPPEPGMLVAAAIADGLARRGHRVDVLTGFPNYPTGRVHEGFPVRPYRCDRRSAGVTVHRAPLFPSHDASAVRRAANYSSYAVAASWVARRRLPRPDAWLVYSSPATAAVPALTAPRRLQAPVYLLIQDLWPDSVLDSGMGGRLTGRLIGPALQRFCDWTYRRAAGIGVISPGMRSVLTDRGVDPSRLHLVSNWVEDEHLRPPPDRHGELRRSLGLPAGRLFLYAGNLGELQGLEPLLAAFARCPQATLLLVGDGVRRAALQQYATRYALPNIVFRDAVPITEIGRYIAAADVQVVSLLDSPLLRVTTPSKVQVSMAAGRPILAHAAGDVLDLIGSTGAGIGAPPTDPEATVDAIRRFVAMAPAELADMGRRARAHYELAFSPDAGVDRLLAMLTGRQSEAVRG